MRGLSWKNDVRRCSNEINAANPRELTMGDLGGNVVSDVGLSDSVHEVRSDRSQHVSVDGAESSLGESPLSGTVMRQVGVTGNQRWSVCVDW